MGTSRCGEVISDGQETITLGKVDVCSRGYVSRFNFTGSDQQKNVKRSLWWRTQSSPFGTDVTGRGECALVG